MSTTPLLSTTCTYTCRKAAPSCVGGWMGTSTCWAAARVERDQNTPPPRPEWNGSRTRRRRGPSGKRARHAAAGARVESEQNTPPPGARLQREQDTRPEPERTGGIARGPGTCVPPTPRGSQPHEPEAGHVSARPGRCCRAFAKLLRDAYQDRVVSVGFAISGRLRLGWALSRAAAVPRLRGQ